MAEEAPAHVSGVRKGEEISEDEGKEPGRHDTEVDPQTGRPAGTSDARDSSAIDPQDSVTGGSDMQTGDQGG
jgi:hypothetical protein